VTTRRSEVVFIDGVRTPFGRASDKGMFARTRADDLLVSAIIGLLERNPTIPHDRIDDVVIGAATQTGDQGLTLGRVAAILAGLPRSVPGFSVDRMCAGAMTATAMAAGSIGFGMYELALVGGVEHMGRHPIASGADPNPRFLTERLVGEEALVMGATAERIHDRFPHLTKQRADHFAFRSQEKAAAAYAAGDIQRDLIPVAHATDAGWNLAVRDELPRPDTTVTALATLKTPFRPHGRVTAGNASGLTDGATAALIGSASLAEELRLVPRMRLVSYAFAGVDPEIMGIGPIPATEKALRLAGLRMSDIDCFELNEAFAVQVLSLLDHYDIPDDDPRVNPWGGAIAMGHPLAASGVRLLIQLSRHFQKHPEYRYGLASMCVGLGQGATMIWENLSSKARKR